MKILFVLHQYLPRHVTGTEQYARSLALALRAAGHDVQVFAYEPLLQFEVGAQPWFERDEVVEGVPVHRLAVHPEFTGSGERADHDSPLVGGMFARWFRDQHFDLVHVFHLRLLGTAGIEVPWRHGVPVVVHLMDFWFLCPNHLLLRRDGCRCDGPPDGGFGCLPCVDPRLHDEVERLQLRPSVQALLPHPLPAGSAATTVVARAQALVGRLPRLLAALGKAQAVLAPSAFLRDRFAALGFPAAAVTLLPYGLDAGRLGDVALAPRDGVAGELDVGYLGSLTPHKGVHVAIAAVRGSSRPGLRLHLHGDPTTHPEYVQELRAAAGNDPRIVFHGRFASGELGQVLATLDAVVAPSLWHENTPFTVLEALLAHRPVVAADTGGIAEVVRHETNGLLCPPGDAAALRSQLGRLLDDLPLRQSLARAAGPLPTLADNVAALLGLYAGLLAGTAERR